MKKTIKNKGFTIVELIVVMAIIAILILIAVPTFTKYIDNANKTSEMGTADTIYKATMATVVEDYVDSAVLTATELKDSIDEGVDGTAKTTVTAYTASTPTYTNTDTSVWDIYIKGTTNSDSKITVDATADIYMVAPAIDGNRNVYKNGDFDSTIKTTTSGS